MTQRPFGGAGAKRSGDRKVGYNAGLSRRRSRVRVPSAPLRTPLQRGVFCLVSIVRAYPDRDSNPRPTHRFAMLRRGRATPNLRFRVPSAPLRTPLQRGVFCWLIVRAYPRRDSNPRPTHRFAMLRRGRATPNLRFRVPSAPLRTPLQRGVFCLVLIVRAYPNRDSNPRPTHRFAMLRRGRATPNLRFRVPSAPLRTPLQRGVFCLVSIVRAYPDRDSNPRPTHRFAMLRRPRRRFSVLGWNRLVEVRLGSG